VNVGEVLKVPGAEEEVDDDRYGKANLGAWSASSITSSGEGEEWPERRWSSGVVAGADPLQVRVEECVREEHQRKWRGLGGDREHGAH
jgi:hypothetical protein